MGNDRGGRVRHILIIIFSAITAGITAVLALFSKNIGHGLAVMLGYVILLASAVLINLFLSGSTDETKRTALLVFSLGVLVFFLGGIIHILFTRGIPSFSVPSVSEEHIPSHPNSVIGGADEKTSIIVVDSQDEIASSSDSTDNTDEPFVPSLSEEYSNIDTILQGEIAVEDIEVPSSPELSYYIMYPETVTVIDLEEVVPSAPELTNTITYSESSEIIIENTNQNTDEETTAVDNTDEDTGNIDEASDEEVFGYYQGHPWESDDFWSTFYIAGEESFVLADGIYYMTLQINGEDVGTVETMITNGEASIKSDEFRSYIDGSVIDEVVERIFSGSSDTYIPLSYLQEIGIPAELNTDEYIVSLSFSASDMPVQIISIRSSGRGFSRRPIANAEVIDPAIFYIASRYNLSTSFNFGNSDIFRNSLAFSLSSSNNLRLFDIYGSFNYYLTWNLDSLHFRFGSYRFYKDFQDEMIRLEWGNIDSDLLSPAGTTVGIGFEKALSYGRPGTRSRSHIEKLLVIEKESDVQILNEGREIFRRTLQPGSYRLQDFVLYTGANRIRIIVSPLDGSPVEETDIDINYTSSLLAPGEVYYGASVATGREVYSNGDIQRKGAIRIPTSRSGGVAYDPRNIVLSGNINAGLSESLTMDLALAVQNRLSEESWFNPSMSSALELTHANVLGTTRYSLRATEHMEGTQFTLPDLYGRIGHQVYFDSSNISTLNLSATYSGDTVDNTLSVSLGLSGSFGIFSWGLNGYISSDFTGIDGFSWNANGSFSFSAGRNVWISASVDATSNGLNAPVIGGRISATVRFAGGNANATWSDSNSSVSTNIYKSRHSFSARLDTDNLADINAYNLDADYSYDGNFINFSASLEADDVFRSTRTALTLSTSTLFADGLFTVRSTIPSNFLLIKQEGLLRGNELSIGSAGSSSSVVLDNVLGSYMYSGLSSSQDTSLSLYSTAASSFASSEVFDITLPATERRGYVLRLNAEATYTYSGLVYSGDVLWTNASSPLYLLTEDENGSLQYSSTDSYIFTDSDGRFIISGLLPGMYGFDVMTDSGWVLYVFTVADDEENASLVHMLGDVAHDQEIVVTDPYIGAMRYELDNAVTSEEFWLLLYPEMREATA